MPFVSKANMTRPLWIFTFMPASLCANAQTTYPTEFPPDAQTITAASFDERIAGRVYKGVTASGTDWRMEFRKDGYFFWNSGGPAQSGKWLIEGDKLCGDFKNPRNNTCNEFRIKDDMVFYKRLSNGEVVTLKAQN